MAGRWLLKSEPSTYSWSDLVRDGTTRWDGISAPAALIYLRQMRKSDEVLFYHSGADRAIVGVARVVSDPYPDPKLSDPRRVVIDLAPIRALPRPVPLAAIKSDPRFKSFPLVRISRLSTMPVSEVEWKLLLRMGGAASR